MEELNEKADEIEQDHNNLPDAPFEMKTRGRRRSYKSEDSISTDSDESDGENSYRTPGESSDDDATIRETDLDATEVNFTNKLVPGYQVVQEDLFKCRQQKGRVMPMLLLIASPLMPPCVQASQSPSVNTSKV